MKTKSKILVGTVFFILCFVNIKVILDPGQKSKLTLSSSNNASAELRVHTWVCRSCDPERYGPGVIEVTCPLGPVPDCWFLNCSYGYC